MSASSSPRPFRALPGADRRTVGAPPSSVPRAGIDPITSAAQALALFRCVRHLPPVPETLAFLLDDAGRGQGTVVQVTDTIGPDDVVDVVELIGRAAADRVADGVVSGLVVATCRPRDGLLEDDDTRWRILSDLAEAHGLLLIEWFVLGSIGTACPRDLCGEAARWPAR